jgi:hypothetical protein
MTMHKAIGIVVLSGLWGATCGTAEWSIWVAATGGVVIGVLRVIEDVLNGDDS